MPPAFASLKLSLKTTSSLRDEIRLGLDALTREHRSLIAESERTRVEDSLDFDNAVRAEHGQENRWDYIVSVPGGLGLVGIEPHSASTAEVSVVIAKKTFTANYLRAHLVPGHSISTWLWVSKGRANFARLEAVRRRLSKNGIEYRGKLIRSLGAEKARQRARQH